MNAAMRSQRDAIRGMLADLKMPGSLEAVDGILSDIDGGHLGGPEAINRLLSAQITLRNNRRLQAAMRSSRLPAVKTLESFDFSFQQLPPPSGYGVHIQSQKLGDLTVASISRLCGLPAPHTGAAAARPASCRKE